MPTALCQSEKGDGKWSFSLKEGFIKFHPLGSWWEHTLLAQQVTIKTVKGGVPGIIGAKPVHHLKEEERKNVLDIEEMFIAVGACGKEAFPSGTRTATRAF